MTSITSGYNLFLTHNRLKVTNAKSYIQFYCKHFGMEVIDCIHTTETNGRVTETYFVGYPDQDRKNISKTRAYLEISSDKTNVDKEKSSACDQSGLNNINCEKEIGVYWKIGVNVYDLEHAAKRLKAENVKMGDVLDIADVGVLCHVYDDEGYDTELMQFTMGGDKLQYEQTELCTLGQAAVFSVITIRVQDIDKSLEFYCGLLGMKTLCKQDQTKDYNFDVYYLGFTKEVPPNEDDLNDISNREWTYQRAYTLLEILVYTGRRAKQSTPFRNLSPDETGFMGIGMACDNILAVKRHLDSRFYPYKEEFSTTFKSKIVTLTDPDDIPIRITET